MAYWNGVHIWCWRTQYKMASTHWDVEENSRHRQRKAKKIAGFMKDDWRKRGLWKRELRAEYSIKEASNQSYWHTLSLGQEIFAFLPSKEYLNFRYKKCCNNSYAMEQVTLECVETNVTGGFWKICVSRTIKNNCWFPCSETEWLLDVTSPPHFLYFFNHIIYCPESVSYLFSTYLWFYFQTSNVAN